MPQCFTRSLVALTAVFALGCAAKPTEPQSSAPAPVVAESRPVETPRLPPEEPARPAEKETPKPAPPPVPPPAPKPPALGVHLADLNDPETCQKIEAALKEAGSRLPAVPGLFVSSIESGGLAEKIGLKKFDTLTACNGKTLTSLASFKGIADSGVSWVDSSFLVRRLVVDGWDKRLVAAGRAVPLPVPVLGRYQIEKIAPGDTFHVSDDPIFKIAQVITDDEAHLTFGRAMRFSLKGVSTAGFTDGATITLKPDILFVASGTVRYQSLAGQRTILRIEKAPADLVKALVLASITEEPRYPKKEESPPEDDKPKPAKPTKPPAKGAKPGAKK